MGFTQILVIQWAKFMGQFAYTQIEMKHFLALVLLCFYAF